MIYDFTEKFSDLIVPSESGELKQLKTIPGEDRGDDMGSSLMSEMDCSDESLFLLSKKFPEDGFIANYCFREETKNRLKKIYANSAEYEEKFIDRFRPFLPMTYNEFMQLDLSEQMSIINTIKKTKYEKLHLLPTAYSKEDKARIRAMESEIINNN